MSSKKNFLIIIGVLSIIPLFASITGQVTEDVIVSDQTNEKTLSLDIVTVDANLKEFDLSAIDDSSKINMMNMTLTINNDISDICVLKVEDELLNDYAISNEFPCFGIIDAELNSYGVDAVKNNLLTDSIKFIVKNSNDDVIDFVISDVNILHEERKFFALVDGGVVTNVIVADNDFMSSQKGVWIETKYDSSNRGNFAGIGSIYDDVNDVFYPQKPFNSWVLNSTDWQWYAPVDYPNNGSEYYWSEQDLLWLERK